MTSNETNHFQDPNPKDFDIKAQTTKNLKSHQYVAASQHPSLSLPPLIFKICDSMPPVKTIQNPKFGSVFSPHMLSMKISATTSEYLAEIKPYGQELFSPAALVLHYGQSIFEGMKAFPIVTTPKGVGVFRLDLHAQRFANSCKLMSMPVLPPKIFERCVMEFVKIERDSVPRFDDHSLYLRPVMFAVDSLIKMGRGLQYQFYILGAMAGNYFSDRTTPGARVYVNRRFVRAYPGGLGEAKTAANYAASLAPLAHAASLGCDQILYLHAVNHDQVDELGGMNFFAVTNDGTIVTPPLKGTILDGITRRSILELAPRLGIKAEERPISFSQLEKEIVSGRITECFACGTAAVVEPISEFLIEEEGGAPRRIELKKSFEVANRIRSELVAVQRCQVKAPGDWVFEV